MLEPSIDLFPGSPAQSGRPEPGTVAICFVAAALEALRVRRMDTDEILIAVGLSPTLLQSPHARVSAEHYGNCGAWSR
jgi:hypothetical protein